MRFETVLFFATLFGSSVAARILVVMPTYAYSHQTTFHQLWRKLLESGHHLTLLSTHPLEDLSLTNLTEIKLPHLPELKHEQDLKERGENSLSIDTMDSSTRVAILTMDAQLGHPEVQAMIKNETEHFDLLIIESFAMQAHHAFAVRFNCPFVGVSSLNPLSHVHYSVGNPAHPVLNPNFFLPFYKETTFFERLLSTAFVAIFHFFAFDFTNGPVVKKRFGEDYPSVREIAKNMSVLLMNTGPFHQNRPLVPSVIQIGGGIHLKDPQPLPKDLQKIIDGVKDGFIYLSLGTSLTSEDLESDKMNIIVEVLAELPYTVFWKYEAEELPGKPDNVIIRKWFPQQDLLRHPKLKLFITQGGLQSLEEAILNHVPVLGLPITYDQVPNMKQAVESELGVYILIHDLTKEKFSKSVWDVINNNDRYRNNLKKYTKVLLDQPMTGLEKAVWWIEYVLRHKGAKHLRSPAIDLPFYQYFLLDVICFCLAVVFVIVFLLYKVIRLISKCFNGFRRKRKVKKQ